MHKSSGKGWFRTGPGNSAFLTGSQTKLTLLLKDHILSRGFRRNHFCMQAFHLALFEKSPNTFFKSGKNYTKWNLTVIMSRLRRSTGLSDGTFQ
jgi:hypothetical protein